MISLTDNGQSSTRCLPILKLSDEKRNIIRTSLIVVTIVLSIICIVYFVLFAIEKNILNARSEERVYVNQIMISTA